MPDKVLRLPREVTPEQFSQLCDVVERAWQRWPVDSWVGDPFNHTSAYARAAASRLLEILGPALDVEPPVLVAHRPSSGPSRGRQGRARRAPGRLGREP